jgi:hypothetical protein
LYNERDWNRELRDEEAKRVKFYLLGPLSQAHNIVVYIYRLASCIEAFRKLAKRMIPIDNCIRWNS